MSGVQQRKKASEAYASVGQRLGEEKMTHVRETLERFRSSLSAFAHDHKEKIGRDPEFRFQFNRMCDSIGIDPLTSSKVSLALSKRSD